MRSAMIGGLAESFEPRTHDVLYIRQHQGRCLFHTLHPYLIITFLLTKVSPLVQHPIIAMSQRSFRIKPADVAIFVTGFLATDYLWYTQKPKYINSIVWARVLDNKDDPTKQQDGLPGSSSGPREQEDDR